MNLANLKTGMLIRDMDKLLEVVRVTDDHATAVVLLEDLDRPARAAQVTYSADGVWSFVASPSDKQLAALEALRNERVGFAAVRAELEANWEPQLSDEAIRPGDRVSWVRNGGYRVHGFFWKNVRDYCVCVALATNKRVALRPWEVTKECG